MKTVEMALNENNYHALLILDNYLRNTTKLVVILKLTK